MKKIFAIFLTLCLIAEALCITAFAADNEPDEGTVLRVGALKRDGSYEFIEDYDNFENGWNDAMEIADDADEMKDNHYDRIVVDLYADWTAQYGRFTDDYWNGPGFDWDTIYFQDDVKFTLNMNGHTIDRAMTTWEYNGEVMTIDEDADIIINNGTIKGGWSSNGAGGIHIHDGANVTLNNVNVIGNTADDDDGGGIAVYDGATLTMNGGSLKDNYIDSMANGYKGVAVYVEDSVAIFNDVEFKNNQAYTNLSMGAAIYSSSSQITLNRCTFDGNGNYDAEKKYGPTQSLIGIYGSSTATIKDCTFINNGAVEGYTYEFNAIRLSDSTLIMDNSEFKNNNYVSLLDVFSSSFYISNTKFTDNFGSVIHANYTNPDNSYFRNCTFNKNVQDRYYSYYSFEDIFSTVTFYDCDFGDSTFDYSSNVKIEDTDIPDGEVALSIGMLLEDGQIIPVSKYRDVVFGWNAAMELASNGKETGTGSTRVVVDLYIDWTAVNGEFCNSGTGFDWDAIYFPSNVSVTLNLNGHTIDRGLTESEANGEVMCIDSGADVIINDGTIKGGFSTNGAGGIHVKSDAKVTLNNVHLDENEVEQDDGAAIALYDGATLVMNGGSVSDNTVDCGDGMAWGAVCVNESTATFNNVIFSGNESNNEGSVIYAIGSTVTLNNCTVESNDKNDDTYHWTSVFLLDDSNFTICGGEIKDNGTAKVDTLFYFDGPSSLNMSDGCKVTGNHTASIFAQIHNGGAWCSVTDCDFIDNDGMIAIKYSYAPKSYAFSKCRFNNNNVAGLSEYDFYGYEGIELNLIDCDLGDSTFSGEEYINFIYNDVPEAEGVIRVSVILKDGTTYSSAYYNDLRTGWNAAMELSKMRNYESVVIDLYVDWNATSGVFGKLESGFKWDTLYVPENARITLNMNGHTINRGLTEDRANGEVIYIDKSACVVINGGNITGGFSNNGAGGIHVCDGANLTLKDVNVIGNAVKGDDGAGIALYNGAVLNMEGGSISGNHMEYQHVYAPFVSSLLNIYPYGSLYVNNATAILNKVAISNNSAGQYDAEGVAIYATGSSLILNECVVSGNALRTDTTAYASSVIAAYSSKLMIQNTEFTNNASNDASYNSDGARHPLLFYFEDSIITIDGGKITGNNARELFEFNETDANITGVTITDNTSLVANVKNNAKKVIFTDCTLGNNSPTIDYKEFRVENEDTLVMKNCTLGDTTFENKNMVNGVGSIFGEGSLTMIVAILALVAAGAAIFMNVYSKKKVLVGNADETEGEEDNTASEE